jgi:Uma2 family endonuclease
MENLIKEPAVAYGNRYTAEEYLEMEWENGVRYEYWDGELVAMSYATLAHNRLAFNVTTIFSPEKR